MKNIFVSLLLAIFLISSSCSNINTKSSNILSYGSPSEAGMSKSKIKLAENLYKDALKENKVLGYQILVARKGKIVLHAANGVRDFEKQVPFKKHTLVNVASNTKSLVAIAILKLADEGKLSIEDYVSQYIDEFNEAQSRKITIKQLLLHKGGFLNFTPFLGEITQNSSKNPDAPSLIVEAKKIGKAGPDVEPGTKYRYNNLGYNVLGAVIEKVSNKKLHTYFKENIYNPLGMNDTFHMLSDIDTTKMAKQYYYHNKKWKRMDVLFTPFARANAGTITTAWDFAKVFQMLVNKGAYNNFEILKQSTVKHATSPIIKISEAYLSEEVEKNLGLPSSEWYEYRDARSLNIDNHRGYGFVVSDTGGYSHAGVYGTFAYADPKEELVIILFTQSIYGGNPGQKFIETIYKAINDY